MAGARLMACLRLGARGAAASVVPLALALACAAELPEGAPGEEEPTFALTIAVRAELEPLSGVRVFGGEALLGETNAEGSLPIELRGTEGERVPLRIECPASYQSPPQPLVVGLWHPSEGAAAPTFEVECVPSVHCHVVGIAAENGPQLPVSYLSQPVGRTDEQGLAHVLTCAPSHEQISLRLDTSARPELRPQNPELTFVAGERAELVLLQVELSEARRKRAPRPTRPIPIEIKH